MTRPQDHRIGALAFSFYRTGQEREGGKLKMVWGKRTFKYADYGPYMDRLEKLLMAIECGNQRLLRRCPAQGTHECVRRLRACWRERPSENHRYPAHRGCHDRRIHFPFSVPPRYLISARPFRTPAIASTSI